MSILFINTVFNFYNDCPKRKYRNFYTNVLPVFSPERKRVLFWLFFNKNNRLRNWLHFHVAWIVYPLNILYIELCKLFYTSSFEKLNALILQLSLLTQTEPVQTHRLCHWLILCKFFSSSRCDITSYHYLLTPNTELYICICGCVCENFATFWDNALKNSEISGII